MRLIVNIPAYNEEKRLGETIARIPRKIEGIDEVLVQVVDDGSSDRTAKVAAEAGADFVIRHRVNRRLGKVFRSAVENALARKADIMVNIDADGQFDPGFIPTIIKPILSGRADMTIGDRFAGGQADGIPFLKDKLNRLGAWLVGRFLRVDIHDLTCGFRAHNRETLLRLNPPTGFTYTQETIIDAIGKGLKIIWVPVKVRYFRDRRSRVVRSVYDFVNNSARIIIKAVRDVRPMKFFGIPGLFLILLSFVSFGIFLSLYLPELKISPYRNHLLVAIVLFLIGLQFIVFAFIADMIKANRKLTEEMMYQLRKSRYGKNDD
ncbi:MAG TPA: glycosyltransferase family 2 protein [Candidatus Moranbacteria bacterium]|nr:glycosyltransferase family 2 protein [Candidatus Moranbacteria bacterium]